MRKKLLIAFLCFSIIGGFYFYNLKKGERNVLQDIEIADIESLFSKNISESNSIRLTAGVDLIPDDDSESVARNNTMKLQAAIDDVSNAGGGSVYLPAGTYYFLKGGVAAQGEVYVIRPRNNVHLVGAGTNESRNEELTVLKPIYNSPNSIGGMDMFYFNNYADTNYNTSYSYPTLTQTRNVTYHDINGSLQTLENQTVYLINADFSNFVIDADRNFGGSYNTSGKGFMINLFANCDWNNVVVKNTDGTGFGMDCPINSSIRNAVAINCGKKALETNGGASGFGIGMGISDLESFVIDNSISIGNKKYGFFFEDQARFNPNNYKATSSSGFVVMNSVAGGNLYDFGGLKAYDVTYQYVKSISGMGSYSYYNRSYDLTRNKGPFNFSLYTVNSRIVNSDFGSYVSDVSNYSEQVYWALNNGYMPANGGNSFEPNKVITREDAVVYLYNYKGREGNVAVRSTNDDQSGTLNDIKTRGGFMDVEIPNKDLDVDNMNAILWGIDKHILSYDSKFRGNDECSRAEFFTMLYRLAGAPSVTGSVPFVDVDANSWYYNAVVWAYQNQITNGKGNNLFAPTDKITKVEVAIALFRYNRLNSNYSITYNYLGGSGNNRLSYNTDDTPFVLSNPSKSGYTFLGWTGSNGKNPSRYVTVPTGSTGNLVYTANWQIDMVGIYVKDNPRTLDYMVGDEFDASGLVIEVLYGDGSRQVLDSGFTIAPVDMRTAGRKTVTVTYEGISTSFMINVASASSNVRVDEIRVSDMPKTEYVIGEILDTNGLTLEVSYNDGSKRVIADGYEVVSISLDTVGMKKVYVKYEGKETYYEVNVGGESLPVTLSSIEIANPPVKTQYYVGDEFSTTGLSIRLIYSDGSRRVVSNGFTVSYVNMNRSGVKTVTISYEDKTISYEINVSELQVEEISIISLPDRLVYYVGDTLQTTGLVLSVKYSNGEVTEVIDNFETSIANGNKLAVVGESRITVTYGNKKTYYTIHVVNNDSESMIISRYPYKMEYFVGEILDLSGLEFKKVDSDGNVEVITGGYQSSIPDKTTLTEVGKQTIIVSYDGYEFTIDINVLKIESLGIKSNTLQTSYRVGDAFKADDLVLIANCNDGLQREIKNGYELSIDTDTVLNDTGEKMITIYYGNKQVTTSLKVKGSLDIDRKYVVGFIVGLVILVFIRNVKKEGILEIVK